MPKFLAVLIGASIVTVIAAGGLAAYTAVTKPASIRTVGPTRTPTPVDTASHNVYDTDLAKKFVLYHELAAQLDQYAIENTVHETVRALATQQRTYNIQQVAVYAAVLQAWNEPYSRLEDFPKIAGSSCGTYPTFPGMLPHAEVTAYLQSDGENVDTDYLRLTSQHHNDITTTISANEEYANNGELAELRKTFLVLRDAEMKQIQQLQAELRRA